MADVQKWVVYMVECADGSLYTGVSTDLDRRLRQHNGELKGGAGYTRARRPVRLVWSEAAEDRSGAQLKEYVVRRLKAAEKRRLIEGKVNVDQYQ